MDDSVVAAAAALPSPWSLLQGLLALLIVLVSYRAAETFWLRPRLLDRALWTQCLTGTEYCFPAGDLKENATLNNEARSRSMPPCHDIIPHVMPHLFNTVKKHGDICITWFGPIPRVVITEAELIRDILSNKFGHFEKFNINERLIKAFQYMYIPGFMFFPTQNNRRMNEINREIEGTLRGMIEKRERAIENGEAGGNDGLGLLLQSNHYGRGKIPRVS
ncbi:cytochrome P450 CYP72A616-like [Miscanthus floridulus]|uniref:cytochrome P450 CYP72A616-like n=1 Tax=Miscanthus floridulus TaxID=154761 RepID=UPI003457CEEB